MVLVNTTPSGKSCQTRSQTSCKEVTGVALFTKAGPKENKYWLVRVVQPKNSSVTAQVLDRDEVCPISDEEFEKGQVSVP